MAVCSTTALRKYLTQHSNLGQPLREKASSTTGGHAKGETIRNSGRYRRPLFKSSLREEVAMAVRKRRSDRSGRGALPSPGRPYVARREDHRQFWAAIAAGRSSEDAAVGAGVSPAVGARWFRRAGGMPPSQLAPSAKPLSGRSLSFAER